MAAPGDLVLVVTTHPEEGADALARALVDRRVAACVQAVPVRSIYRWEGEVETAAEVRLECKTSRAAAAACLAAIRELHPYDVPEILVLDADADDAYARWAADETRGA